MSVLPVGNVSGNKTASNGLIYVVGGSYDYDELRNVEVFDPIVNIWTTATSLPIGRESPGAALVNNRIYIIGGFDGSYTHTVFVGALP